VNGCTVAPTQPSQCYVNLHTGSYPDSGSTHLELYAEAFLNSTNQWSERIPLNNNGLYTGGIERASIGVFEVPAAVRLSVDEGAKPWGYWKVQPSAFARCSLPVWAHRPSTDAQRLPRDRR